MTVTYIGIDAESRSVTGGLGERTYKITYKLEASATTDTANTVRLNPLLPSVGSVHPDDDAAYCTDVDINCTGGYKWWTATATWSTARKLSAEDPEEDEVLISWESEIYQEPIYQDISGNGLINSAGDYFIDPVPTRDNVHLIAKIKANLRSLPLWMLNKQNHVNSSEITVDGLVIPAGLARVSRFAISDRKRRGDTDYREFSYAVHVHEKGWRLEPLDAGFRHWEYGELVQIKDSKGDEVTTPVPLDGAGVVLEAPTPATVVYGNYKVYAESDLAGLPGID